MYEMVESIGSWMEQNLPAFYCGWAGQAYGEQGQWGAMECVGATTEKPSKPRLWHAHEFVSHLFRPKPSGASPSIYWKERLW